MWTIKNTDLTKLLTGVKTSGDFFDVTNRNLSAKEFFFPPEETTFSVETESNTVTVPKGPKAFTLYGLTLNDLEAIALMDKLMDKPEPDFYYQRRRKRALLIGVTENNFDLPPGGDIIIKRSGRNSYQLTAVTGMGRRTVKKHLPGLKEQNHSNNREHKPCKEQAMPDLCILLLDTELLKNAVLWSWYNYKKLWNRLSEQCLGCGICTYVCPLCHCFAIEDKIELSGKQASRRRRWDACTLPGFAKISGGHNFHPGIKERYYNWFYHKFVRSYHESGTAQCVACGRCQTNCPARIDIEEVLTDIVVRYWKQKHKS